MSFQNKRQNICVKYDKIIIMKKFGPLRQPAMFMFAVGTRLDDGSLKQRRLNIDWCNIFFFLGESQSLFMVFQKRLP